MSDRPIACPLAVFGKSDTASRTPQGYGFLAAHPVFDSPAMRRDLRRVVSAIEWKASAGSDQAHRPLFAILDRPHAGGQFVVRFLDSGRDPSGRPHCLRAECVALPPETPGPAIAAVLSERAWPDLPPGDPPTTVALNPGPGPADSEKAAHIAAALARHPDTVLILRYRRDDFHASPDALVIEVGEAG